jgi:hypothetical protein
MSASQPFAIASSTNQRHIHVADHFHDIRDLVGGDNAATL